MAGWREKKRKALGDVHRSFEIPAVYLTHAAGSPIRVSVRLHLKQIQSAKEGADWSNSASMLDLTSRVIFSREEIGQVLPHSFVIFGNDEAYLTGPSKPEREGYLWVEVTDVSQDDLATLIASLDLTDPAYAGIVHRQRLLLSGDMRAPTGARTRYLTLSGDDE